jgi:5'-3' exoribonuclease 1
MIGNDFLPNMPSLEISNKGIEILLSTYSKVYLNHGYIIRELANNLYLNKKAFLSLLEELSNLEIMMILEKYNKGYAKYPDRLLAKYIMRTEQGTNIDFIEYRKDYYKTKLDVENETFEEEIEEICRDYIKGMNFVLLYYFKSIPTFEYCYERHYAPFFSDLYKVAQKMTFENKLDYYTIPFNPVKPLGIYESLVGILPPSSFNLLPENIREEIGKKILLDSDFLEEFETDLDGKINDYEAILLLPFVSYKKIKRLFKNISLTPEQENKNKIKCIYSF